MTLRRKMAHGAMWSLVEKAGNQVVSLIVFMFVARMIGPKEYGLANICFVYFTLANILILGLMDGIISLQIYDPRRLSTMFWCVMALGGVLTLSCLFLAGSIAELMDEPRLASLLSWFSIVFIFLSASVVPNKLIAQALNFKIFALRTLVAALISGCIGLIMAYYNMGAYAIIGQQIILYLIMNIIVWLNIDWRPSFVFDRNIIKESLLPGIRMIGADLIGFSQDQLPRLFIGGVLGSVSLGYYAFVNRLRYALQDILIHPSLSVLCPAITRIKEDHEEQKLILGQFIELIGFFMFPVLALGAATAPLYVPLFFGEVWTPAIVVLQIFICGSAYIPILITIREALRAHNCMGKFIKIQAPLVAVELFSIIILLPHGLVPMSIGVVGCASISVPVYVHFFKRWVGISLWKAILKLIRPLAAVFIMLVIMYAYPHLSAYPINKWLELISSLILGAIVYLAACFVIQYQEMIKMLSFAKKLKSMKSMPQSGI